MTLRFPYRPDRRTRLRTTPSHEPGQVWPMRALIPVRIIGSAGSVQLDQVLVDNGSVDSIFPLGMASWVGATLIARPAGVQWNIRWRGGSHPLEFAQVEIELTDHSGAGLRWPATVGFSSNPL